MVKLFSRFRWNMDVKIAGNGKEAVDLASRLEFDLIFMDILMRKFPKPLNTSLNFSI